MTPTENVYTAGLWYTSCHKVGDHIYNPAICLVGEL